MKRFNLKEFIQNSFVRKWFIMLLSFVTVLFLLFMAYTHINSIKALQHEYTSYSELQTERIAEQLDENFRSYSRVTALLSLDTNTRIYLFNENADSLFTGIHGQISSQLSSYTEGFPAIDSIYLFPAYEDEFFRSGERTPNSYISLDDKTCLSIQEAPETLTLVPREKNGRYPYLMTIYLPLYEQGEKALIVVNINLSEIVLLKDSLADSLQQIYIVSDEGKLLHRSGQRDIPENIELVPELKHFDSNRNFFSQYIDESAPYIYVQQHSSKYPWSYVTITTPEIYMGKSFDLFASLLAFLPWLLLLALVIIICLVILATHPIRTITDFLDNPLLELPDNISEPETQKIVRQFINYIQTNRTLSEELEKQMERQNKATYWALQSQINPHFLFNTLNLIRNVEIQELGYDHPAPELTLSLSRLMQYALDDTNLVPLKTEFYYTDLYLRILNQRYNGKLHFNIEKDEQLSELLVPKLILQPLIENAVFHGCSPALDNHNTILVRSTVWDDRCTITIKDNGIGISPEVLEQLQEKLQKMEQIPSDSIGLQNVVFRMYLTYGEQFQFSIDSTLEEGTCITLSFPANLSIQD